ncbi:MAG: phosphonoacetate hydrolase [Rhodospirillaceae bacterium]|nr:phosphonoacetate hydrolase [Rhodospirillaceae bacterium]
MAVDNIELNGITYAWPKKPVAVVCIDGGDPLYMDHGFSGGIIPTMTRFRDEGFYAVARGSMPSFTCPNNMSIVTGTEPNQHGISGNFYLDRKTGEPVVMTEPGLLRSRSVMAEFSRHGAKVASVTAKDKLRKQLQKDMDLSNGSVSFSAQFADQCTVAENGIDNVLDYVGKPLPDMYSADLSLFVLDAGIRLLEERRPDILYLSLTDFIQHAHAPGAPEADDFYKELDARFQRLQELGAIVALTADHGMADKADADGNPNVIWLQDILEEAFGEGCCQVICPITDAFVGHHGALGGFVRVYCNDGLTADQVLDAIKDVPGIGKAWNAEGVVEELEQPLDREGDVAVMGDATTVIGARAVDHDLSALKGKRLRTHGSLTEADVPFVISEALNEAYAARAAKGGLRSHEIFDFALNGVA